MAPAIGAYLLWGITPIYWKLVAMVPAHEILVPRIFWTGALMVVLLLATRRMGDLLATARTHFLPTVAAALLIATNWGIFIYAVQTGQIVATSLGYYINPLVSIFLGLLILGERLNRAQTLAVLCAGAGVAYVTVQAGRLPWIAACLAISFALYGLAHKLAPRPPFVGLALEMLILVPAALLGWAILAARGELTLASADWQTHALVALSGIVTAAPLLLFHAATHRLPLVTIGMLQYIAPTLSLVLAVVLYDEAFTWSHAIGFGCVWVGLAIFSADSLLRTRALPSDARADPG
ncbi:MAG: EamA family transporter RarD [Deltaproteobacteria bacterium]|nr:EamA family transporter RarD [Deltaproteobacteria bacterium]MBW2419517.1 EamA family transporter RarD [Deltaproteobacteria bacterium]